MTNYLADKLAIPTGDFLDANMGLDVQALGERIAVDFGPELLNFAARFANRKLFIRIAKGGQSYEEFSVAIPVGDTEDHLVSGLSFNDKTLTINASDGTSYDVVLPLNYDEHSFTGDGTVDDQLTISGEAVLERTLGFTTTENPSIIINKTDRINETFTSDTCQFISDSDDGITMLDGLLTGTIRLRLTNSTLSTLQSSRLEVINADGSVVYGTQEVIFGGITPISIALNNIETDRLCLRWVGRDSRIFHATVSIDYDDIAIHSDGPLHDNVVHLADNEVIQRTEPIKAQLSETSNLLNATITTQNAIKAITDDLESITITRYEPVAFVVSNDPYLTDFSGASIGARNVRTQDYVYILGSSQRIAMSNPDGEDVGFSLVGSNGDPVYFRYRPHIATATTLNVNHSIRIETLQVKQDIITLRNDVSALQQDVNANRRAIDDNTLLSDEREAVGLLTQNLVDNDTFVNVVDGVRVLKIYHIPENTTHGEAVDLEPLVSRDLTTECIHFDDKIERITYNGTKATDRGNLFDRLTLKNVGYNLLEVGNYLDGNYIFKLDFKPFHNHYAARQGIFFWEVGTGETYQVEIRDRKLTIIAHLDDSDGNTATFGPIQIDEELIGEKRHGITISIIMLNGSMLGIRVSCFRHDIAGVVKVGTMTLEVNSDSVGINLLQVQHLQNIIIGSGAENNGVVWSDFFNPAARDRSKYPVPYTTDDGFYTRQEKVFITGTTTVFADLPQTDNDWEVGFDIADAQATIDGTNCARKMFALGNIPMDRFTLRHKIGFDAKSECKFWFKRENLQKKDLFPKPASIGLSWGYSENYSQYDYHFFVSSEDSDQYSIDNSVAGYSILTVPVNPEQARLITSIADMRTLVFKDFSVLWTPYFGDDSTMASGTIYNLGYYNIRDDDYDTALVDRITSESDTAFYRLAEGKKLDIPTVSEGSDTATDRVQARGFQTAVNYNDEQRWNIVGGTLTISGKVFADKDAADASGPVGLTISFIKEFKSVPVITGTFCAGRSDGTSRGYVSLNCYQFDDQGTFDTDPTTSQFNFSFGDFADFVANSEVHWIAIGEPAD